MLWFQGLPRKKIFNDGSQFTNILILFLNPFIPTTQLATPSFRRRPESSQTDMQDGLFLVRCLIRGPGYRITSGMTGCKNRVISVTFVVGL